MRFGGPGGVPGGPGRGPLSGHPGILDSQNELKTLAASLVHARDHVPGINERGSRGTPAGPPFSAKSRFPIFVIFDFFHFPNLYGIS